MLFRSTATLVTLAALTSVSVPAIAQKQSAPLLPTLGDAQTLRGTLSGTVRISVSETRDLTRRLSLRAPFGKDGIVGELKIGDTLVATFDSSPFECDWDTTRHSDGGHVLRLVAVDTINDRETLLEQANVFLRNGKRAAPTLPGPALSRASRSARGGPPLDALHHLRSVGTAPPIVPTSATLTKLSPRITLLKSFRDVRATVLSRGQNHLAMGLADGGIAFCTEREAESETGGTVVRLPEDAGATRTVALVGNRVFWVTGRQDIVYRYDLKDKTLAALDVSAANAQAGDSPSSGEAAPGWVRRLSPWRGNVALIGAGTSQGVLRVLKTDGSLSDLCDELPTSIVDKAKMGDVTVCDFGQSGARLAVSVRDRTGGSSLHLYTGKAGGRPDDWSERVMAPVERTVVNRPVAVSAFGVATLNTSYGGGLQGWTWGASSDVTALPELRIGGGGPVGGSLRASHVSIGGSGLWVSADGVLFHVDPASGRRTAYLPWNGAGGTITDLCADTIGLWAATSAGVRRILPARSSDTDGYGGYVRARLDEPDSGPKSERDLTALALAEEWQGVPYLWGGQTKSGTDCSGYVGAIHRACGVNLPRTSRAMGTTGQGKRVRDELQWGDTLVFPGHVAFYIGNGQTAETTNNAVGKASIWRRRDVIVKRFLH